MPWGNYQPVNLYAAALPSPAASLTLRPFNSTTVPANTKVIVNSILLYNSDTVNARNAYLYFVRGGTQVMFYGAALAARATVHISSLVFNLEPGDGIAAYGEGGYINAIISGAVVT